MNRIKRYVLCASLFLAALSLAALSDAQSPFDGTWLIKPAQSKLSTKPFTFYTSQGWFHCVSCYGPPFDVAADGQDHPVTGQTFDTASITIVDANTIKGVYKKDGKAIAEEADTVSRDGKTLTSKYTGYAQNGQVTNSVATSKRVGVLPAGVHATSGNWVAQGFTDTENDLTIIYKTSGDELTMTDPTGDSYTAKFDGKDYPYKGSYQANAVSLKQIDARTIEETDKRDGTVVAVYKMAVSANGKSMTIVYHDPQNDTTSTYVATKK